MLRVGEAILNGNLRVQIISDRSHRGLSVSLHGITLPIIQVKPHTIVVALHDKEREYSYKQGTQEV